MGLTVTEDTPADMLAGNMELLVQLPPRTDDDYDSDDVYEEDENDRRYQLHNRNHHHRHNHHHTNGHHPRRAANGNARKVIVARSTPMMDLLVQVATSQKLSASSYTLEAIGEHGLVLTHHPNTPIGALDALQVKLLPKQGTFAPMKTRHANQPFEPTFRLQVHLPRNQLYVSRVSARMNLGKILDEVCREKNLDPNNYELRHPANIEKTLDLTLSLQDYHLQEVTLCPKHRQLGSSLSSQDIMALQRQEERRRQEAKQSVFGFAFKKSKESSLSTDSLGERSVSPAHSDGTGRSASPQAPPTAPTRPQRKRRPAPKPPTARVEPENIEREITNRQESERTNVISHSRNSSDSSGYHEASVLSDNLDSNIRVPETLPRRSRLQLPSTDSPGRTLAETSEASKSLGNLAAVSSSRSATIARGTSNISLVSAGLRKKKAAPAPPPPRPLTSAISAQALERIVDSEESLPPGADASLTRKTIPDVETETRSIERRNSNESEKPATSMDVVPIPEVSKSPKILMAIPNVEPARERKRVVSAPIPRPRNAIDRYAPSNAQFLEPATPHLHNHQPSPSPSPSPRDFSQSLNNSEYLIGVPKLSEPEKNVEISPPIRPLRRNKNRNMKNDENFDKPDISVVIETVSDYVKVPVEIGRQISEDMGPVAKVDSEENGDSNIGHVTEVEQKNGALKPKEFLVKGDEKVEKIIVKVEEATVVRDEELREKVRRGVSLLERNSNVVDERRDAVKPQEKKISEDKRRVDEAKDQAALHNPSSKINFEPKGTADDLNVPITEGKRSCVVISTIPKCDNFLKHETDDEDEGKSPEIDSPKYNVAVKIDSGLGSSFGAGKSILDSDFRRNEDHASAGTILPSNCTESNDDELELKSFEMFETPETRRKWTKVLRSHSELNNFEINAFGEGGSRYLTSRSVDYTFALNPNFADMNDGENKKRYYSLKDVTAPGKSEPTISPLSAIAGTQLPAFLTSQITWEQKGHLLGVEVEDAGRVGTTSGEPGSDDSGPSAPIVPVPSAAESEPTIDLLKKVSDTLSGSLRSTAMANEIPSSASNDQYSGSESSSLCIDSQPLPPRDGELKLEANGAKPAFPEVIENLRNTEITVEFSNNKHQLAPPPDWEYQLPEPPTAFRDTEEISGEEKTFEKSIVVLESKEMKSLKSPEVISATPPSLKTNSKADDDEEKHAEFIKEEILVNRIGKAVKKEEDEPLNDLGRIPWAGAKPTGDSGSRRASYASSTPSVAPVDNTLSNFVITTYSRPKNVDIFDEIERSESEPRSGTSSRKNSPAFNAFNVGQLAVTRKLGSRKNSNDVIKESQPLEEEKIFTPDVALVQRNAQLDVPKEENEAVETVAMNRSNIKISIATKPRPRADTISGETLQRRKTTVDLKPEEKKPVEEAQINQEVAPSNNQRFSQWRENILKKQETQTAERQLQSLQVLRSILPQSEDSRKLSNANSATDVVDHAPVIETKVEAVAPSIEVPVSEATNEPRVKRYTYAGPPAIDLGSWSDRSRSRVQIKPDTDYKFEKSQEPEARLQEPVNANSNKTTASATAKKPESNPVVENRELRNREPNELTKTLIARTIATGFKRAERPASIAVVEYSSSATMQTKGIKEKEEEVMASKEEEIDTRPINFKELKEAFGKDQKTNSSSTLQFKSKYGSLARRSDTFAGKFPVRRDSNASANGDSEKSGAVIQKTENVIEKRNFVLPANRVIGGFQQQENLRKISRGTPMPVVKGFKLAAPEDETQVSQLEKRPGFRVAIGDISNGNYAPNYTRKNPVIQVKSDSTAKNAVGIPKPPPTMPIITGVTLKSTNAKPRPKSAIVELDPRNQLLESIRGFGGANQLRKVPRRNTNIIEGSGIYARS